MHTEATINEALAALGLMGGPDGVKAVLLAKQDGLPQLRFGDVTIGQLLAGRTKLDDKVWRALLRDDVELALDEAGKLSVRTKDRSLVDGNGRFIPSACGVTAPVVDADWSRFWPRHDLDCIGSLSRLENAFERRIPISASGLQERAEETLSRLTGDERFVGLLGGKHACFLVTVIPQMSEDYGTMLETCIGALERSFLFVRPEGKFNCWFGKRNKNAAYRLQKSVQIYPNIRHRELMRRVSKGFVPGLFFPGCCQGFSPEAMFQLERNLPKKFWFCAAGGVDTCAAWVGKIEAMLQGQGAPEQRMPAVWQQITEYGFSLRQFNSESQGLQFGETINMRGPLGRSACSTVSGGLFLPI